MMMMMMMMMINCLGCKKGLPHRKYRNDYDTYAYKYYSPSCITYHQKPINNYKGKGKAVPLQAWSGPEVSRNLRFPNYMTKAQDGDKIVSPKHWPPLPTGNAPGTHFC